MTSEPQKVIPFTSRQEVIKRSGARCEAMIQLPRAWARCGRTPVEVHHALTRSRGGALLDSLGETYHLIALCPTHHRMVDDMGSVSGLMIDGYVLRDGLHIVYTGPDDYLTERYGPEVRRPSSTGER